MIIITIIIIINNNNNNNNNRNEISKSDSQNVETSEKEDENDNLINCSLIVRKTFELLKYREWSLMGVKCLNLQDEINNYNDNNNDNNRTKNKNTQNSENKNKNRGNQSVRIVRCQICQKEDIWTENHTPVHHSHCMVCLIVLNVN